MDWYELIELKLLWVKRAYNAKVTFALLADCHTWPILNYNADAFWCWESRMKRRRSTSQAKKITFFISHWNARFFFCKQKNCSSVNFPLSNRNIASFNIDWTRATESEGKRACSFYIQYFFSIDIQKKERTKKIRYLLTGHTDTTIWATFIQTSTLVLAGIGIAFIDVDFASCTSKADSTIATIWTGCIDTATAMFAWWAAIMTFVNIFNTIGALVASRTAAHIGPIHRASIAYCASYQK